MLLSGHTVALSVLGVPEGRGMPRGELPCVERTLMSVGVVGREQGVLLFPRFITGR